MVEKAQKVRETSPLHKDEFMDSFYITKTKFKFSDNPIKYQICLDPYYTTKTQHHNDETPKVGTSMGFLMPCYFFKVGFGMNFVVDNEADFESAEAKTAEQIMRSFNSLP